MKESLTTGISFGLTSGIITTLGLIVGLHAGTHSRPAVIGGILTIAIADAFSDALGIHISEESENVHTEKEIWVATGATFFTKFLFALIFLIPVILFSIQTAIIVSIVFGLTTLSAFSYKMARSQKQSPCRVVCEHLAIAILVILVTHLVGNVFSTMIQGI